MAERLNIRHVQLNNIAGIASQNRRDCIAKSPEFICKVAEFIEQKNIICCARHYKSDAHWQLLVLPFGIKKGVPVVTLPVNICLCPWGRWNFLPLLNSLDCKEDYCPDNYKEQRYANQRTVEQPGNRDDKQTPNESKHSANNINAEIEDV